MISKSKISSAISILILTLLLSSFFVSFSIIHHTAWADTTVGNMTQTTTMPKSANFNLTTAAVVTFVLVLLGLAASMLLIGEVRKSENPF